MPDPQPSLRERQCFMRGCTEAATVEDACPLHASPDQLRRVIPRLLGLAQAILDALDAEKTPDYGVGHDRAHAAALKMLGKNPSDPYQGQMVPLDRLSP